MGNWSLPRVPRAGVRWGRHGWQWIPGTRRSLRPVQKTGPHYLGQKEQLQGSFVGWFLSQSWNQDEAAGNLKETWQRRKRLSLSQQLHKAITNRRALALSETGKDGSTVWWFPMSGGSQCSACWNVVCGRTWLELLVCYLSLTRGNKGGLFKRKERGQAFCDHKALKRHCVPFLPSGLGGLLELCHTKLVWIWRRMCISIY